MKYIVIIQLCFSSGLLFPVTPQSYSNNIALMEATRANDIIRMKSLIDAGADVNFHENQEQPCMGQTPLLLAIEARDPKAIKLLLARGARLDDLVTSSPRSKITGLNVSRANIRNNPILMAAIANNAPIDIIEILLQNGADVNHNKDVIYGKNKNTWTPLMLAAYFGRIDLVQLLLQYGAKKSLTNELDGNKKAIDYAHEQGFVDIAHIINSYVHKTMPPAA